MVEHGKIRILEHGSKEMTKLTGHGGSQDGEAESLPHSIRLIFGHVLHFVGRLRGLEHPHVVLDGVACGAGAHFLEYVLQSDRQFG
jgi:hypothetical protein